MAFENKNFKNKSIQKAINTETGSGFPRRPESPSQGSPPPLDPAQRATAPQTLSLSQAAQQNYIKPVPSKSGGINYVINHGRLHDNGYRLLKEGQEVRARVISQKNENLYTIQADDKLIAASPLTVRQDFAADPSNPQSQQAEPPSKTALDEARDYIKQLSDEGLLGDKPLTPDNIETYAKGLAGLLPRSQDPDQLDPNQIVVDKLKQEVEENSGSDLAKALFNIDPEDTSYVHLESFIEQLRDKARAENEPKRIKEEENKQEVAAKQLTMQEKMDQMSRFVLPIGMIFQNIKRPSELRRNRARIAKTNGLQYYTGMVSSFVHGMVGIHLKHSRIPINSTEELFEAITMRDSIGEFVNFGFIQDTYMKMGYSKAEAAIEAESYLNMMSMPNVTQYFGLYASGAHTGIQNALNAYNISDPNVSASNLFTITDESDYSPYGKKDKPEEAEEDYDSALLEGEREKIIEQKLKTLRESTGLKYLSDAEMEYGLLSVLKREPGSVALTLDTDRVDILEDHITRKTLLALQANGQLQSFLDSLSKLDIFELDEIYGKFDIQPSVLKDEASIGAAIEEAKETLFDVLKQTPTGEDINPQKSAEQLIKISIAKLRVNTLSELAISGMTEETFDKDAVKQIIARSSDSVRLTSLNEETGEWSRQRLRTKVADLLDWMGGDPSADDYRLINEASLEELKTPLADVFLQAGDFRRAEYEPLKDLHVKKLFDFDGAVSEEEVSLNSGSSANALSEFPAELSLSIRKKLTASDYNNYQIEPEAQELVKSAYSQMKEDMSDSELEAKRAELERKLNKFLTPMGAKVISDSLIEHVVNSRSPASVVEEERSESSGELPVVTDVTNINNQNEQNQSSGINDSADAGSSQGNLSNTPRSPARGTPARSRKTTSAPQSAPTPSSDLKELFGKLRAAGISDLQKDLSKIALENARNLRKILRDDSNVIISQEEAQALIDYLNPASSFSLEDYIKENSDRFGVKDGKPFVVVDGEEVPLPENVVSSQEALEEFVQKQDELADQARQASENKAKAKVQRKIDSASSLDDLRKLGQSGELKQMLIDAGLDETAANELIESAIEARRPTLEAKVQAARKGLVNSSKVNSIFSANGASLSSKEILDQRSALIGAVKEAIGDAYYDEDELEKAAEQIVSEKLVEATANELRDKTEQSLGFTKSKGKSSNSGKVNLAIHGKPTDVSVKRVEKGYEFSVGKNKIVVPVKPGTTDFAPIFQKVAESLEKVIPNVEASSQASSTPEKKSSTNRERSIGESAEKPAKRKPLSAENFDAGDFSARLSESIRSGKPLILPSNFLVTANVDKSNEFEDDLAASLTETLGISEDSAWDIVAELFEPGKTEFDFSRFAKSLNDKSKKSDQVSTTDGREEELIDLAEDSNEERTPKFNIDDLRQSVSSINTKGKKAKQRSALEEALQANPENESEIRKLAQELKIDLGQPELLTERSSEVPQPSIAQAPAPAPAPAPISTTGSTNSDENIRKRVNEIFNEKIGDLTDDEFYPLLDLYRSGASDDQVRDYLRDNIDIDNVLDMNSVLRNLRNIGIERLEDNNDTVLDTAIAEQINKIKAREAEQEAAKKAAQKAARVAAQEVAAQEVAAQEDNKEGKKKKGKQKQSVKDGIVSSYMEGKDIALSDKELAALESDLDAQFNLAEALKRDLKITADEADRIVESLINTGRYTRKSIINQLKNLVTKSEKSNNTEENNTDDADGVIEFDEPEPVETNQNETLQQEVSQIPTQQLGIPTQQVVPTQQTPVDQNLLDTEILLDQSIASADLSEDQIPLDEEIIQQPIYRLFDDEDETERRDTRDELYEEDEDDDYDRLFTDPTSVRLITYSERFFSTSDVDEDEWETRPTNKTYGQLVDWIDRHNDGTPEGIQTATKGIKGMYKKLFSVNQAVQVADTQTALQPSYTPVFEKYFGQVLQKIEGVSLPEFQETIRAQSKDFMRVITPDPSSLLYWLMQARPISGFINFGIYNHLIGQNRTVDNSNTLKSLFEKMTRSTLDTGGVYAATGNKPITIHISPVLESTKEKFAPERTLGIYTEGSPIAAPTVGSNATNEDRIRNIFLHEYAHLIHHEIRAVGEYTKSLQDGTYSPFPGAAAEDIPETEYEEYREISDEISRFHKAAKESFLKFIFEEEPMFAQVFATQSPLYQKLMQQDEIDWQSFSKIANQISEVLKELDIYHGGKNGIKLAYTPSMYGLTNDREWFAENFGLYMRNPQKFSKKFPQVAVLMDRVSKIYLRRAMTKVSNGSSFPKFAMSQFGINI